MSTKQQQDDLSQPSSNLSLRVLPPLMVLGLERRPLRNVPIYLKLVYACRSSGRHTAAVEQYDLAASLGSRSNDPAYKELEITIGPCTTLSDV